MKTIGLALLASVAATPLLAQKTREMEAHVHGVSRLELAIEGKMVEISLHSPGMDIVGFEYAPSSDAETSAVEAALETLRLPENVITLPAAAECQATEIAAEMQAGEHHHDEGADHAEDEHHGEHAEGEAHEHEDHAEGEDHEHEHEHEHEEGAAHSEFQMHYVFTCEHPEAVTTISLPFFARFEHAQEIEAQYVTETGSGSVEIARETAELTLN